MGAIIAICVTAALVLCLVFLLVWLVNKKNARKSVGELMSQLIQLLTGAFVYNSNVSLSTVLQTTHQNNISWLLCLFSYFTMSLDSILCIVLCLFFALYIICFVYLPLCVYQPLCLSVTLCIIHFLYQLCSISVALSALSISHFVYEPLFQPVPCQPVCPANHFALPTTLPCQPLYPANHFALPTILPCQPLYPTNHFALPATLPCQPLYPANHFTLPTSLLCHSLYPANLFTLPTSLPCQPL